ncbi:type II secretion system F family protein [candidate division NPL-UPA2 bacterium Unc8]|uniref:Type II secretion system F family protein n=1 Tax=candidate division NPL-UPA2 bacterium Unc8 TaxID=1980939 RepID=A0A399FX64_UNCN2|nr:putative type II secretion system protein F [Bacillota bacterium]RII00647.1 MAG: type II secretion system F family protein [candidate division NPL-UPA2 bacterium Unc8]
MSKFKYFSRDWLGQVVEGEMVAALPEEVASQLRKEGNTVISMEEILPSKTIKGYIRSGRVKLAEIVAYTRQLATLINAGLPIISALEGMRKETANPELARITSAIINTISAGATLTESFQQHASHLFSDVYISMIQVGEESGQLPDMLERIAEMTEHDFASRAKINSALRYPFIVVAVMILASIILVGFVIPRFVELFAGFGVELPLPTRILIGINHLGQQYGLFVLVGLAALLFGLGFWSKTGKGKSILDRLKLRLPVFGPILLAGTLTRLCRLFGLLIESGTPIIRTLTYLKGTMDNSIFSNLIEQTRRAVEGGESVSSQFKTCPFMPSLIPHMLTVGEETGKLEEMLHHLADNYNNQLDYKLKTLTASIEPLLILSMGIGVAFLAMAVFMPMWDMVKFAR